MPWFAIGGIDPQTVGEAAAAGAGRVVVVRAIAQAPDPEAAARALRAALQGVPLREPEVGMGRRSRKRSVSAIRAARRRSGWPRRVAQRARNAEVRAQLRPLGPDERPLPLLIAIAISVVLGVGNLVAYAAGRRSTASARPLRDRAAVGPAARRGVGDVGKRYWAVLGFQAILGITVVLAALALLVAGNLAAVAA